VVWQSNGQDGDGGGIFGQRYDGAGSKLGGEFRLNSQTTLLQEDPAVARDPAGNFVVVWTSDQDPGPGIFGQRYDSAGVPLGSEFRVNTYTTGNQERPSVASDASGNFVVVWDGRGLGDSITGIFGQRFDSAGNKRGGEFRVNSYVSQTQWFASVASDASGDFVVVWTSVSQDGDRDGIFGQRYDSAGVAQGAEFRVNSQTVRDQRNASVAVAPDGAFVVVWESSAKYGSYFDIFGQRYDSLGGAQGSEFAVNAYTPVAQTRPRVATDPNGGFLVAWEGHQLFGQRYDGDGMPQGGEFQINSYLTGSQIRASVAATGTDQFLVAWSGNGVGDAVGVFGQRFELGAGAPTMHVGDLDGKAKDAGGSWRAVVKTLVHDDNHLPVSGVLVTYEVPNFGTQTCTTPASGVCEISIVIRDVAPNKTFTVGTLGKFGIGYVPAGNHDPDGDSDGTTIVVNQP
jgi:hypothetical protein